jgi:hypothetical protein
MKALELCYFKEVVGETSLLFSRAFWLVSTTKFTRG